MESGQRDATTAALDEARAAWTSSGDPTQLRRALLRLLTALE